ncbi:Gfo/Idh/MocA family protein [Streptomyces sp. NPDC052042]|uniref:Gfo/Idh/MocA family protein n=1 Tax=Streptomyces sp. NPDC052042 TaxID=3365683 RepID=UPI0037D01E3B
MVLPNARPRCRALVIGFAGHQGQEYLPIIQRHSDIVGGVDPSDSAGRIAQQWGFARYESLDQALCATDFEVAVVTVPHSEHFTICCALLRAGKHVLKEKPFAVTEAQARELAKRVADADRSVYTLVQRGFNPVFGFAREHLSEIGKPYWFSYDYHLNLSSPTSGWRATADAAMGGVLLDMGYHLLDVLSGLFPAPAEVRSAFLHRYEEMRERRLEDLASVHFVYPEGDFAGSLRISRHNLERVEKLTILGTEGALNVTPRQAALHSPDGEVAYRLVSEQPKNTTVNAMFTHYFRNLDNRDYRASHIQRQRAAVQLLDRIYNEQPAGDGTGSGLGTDTRPDAVPEVSARAVRPASGRAVGV